MFYVYKDRNDDYMPYMAVEERYETTYYSSWCKTLLEVLESRRTDHIGYDLTQYDLITVYKSDNNKTTVEQVKAINPELFI